MSAIQYAPPAIQARHDAISGRDTCAPTRQGSIEQAFKELEEELAVLGAASDELLNRISPVLRQQPPQADNRAEQAPRPVTCTLDDVIQARTRTVHAIRRRLADAIERCEL